MTELFLIAHKVRGEPAFDVAVRQTCAVCYKDEPLDDDRLGSTPASGCHACDDLGYWWIIPTSGHRAYPYWHMQIHKDRFAICFPESYWVNIPPMPKALRDHYAVQAAPTERKLTTLNLADLGL
jgi:hypothetical protein